MIWFSFVQRLTLETTEEVTGIPLSSFLGEQKMLEQDCLYLKSLTLERIDTPSFKRIFVTNQYRIPVTFTLVGHGGLIDGIAARVYSSETK